MKRINILLISVLTLLLATCEHKELCYHHPHVTTIRVAFDWREAPKADPEGMCVFFYPLEEEAAPSRYDFTGTTGGQIDIPVGKYRVLCYNNDTEAVLFRGIESLDTHEAFTRDGGLFEPIYGSGAEAAPQASGTEEERVVITPDALWGCVATDVEITETGISYICVPESEKDEWMGRPVVSDEQVITLYPHRLLCLYTYEIRHVEGLKYVAQMSASLSGMSPALPLATEEPDAEPTTLPFEARHDGEATITGGFLTFGQPAANATAHKLALYVWLADGTKWLYTFDVTGQVDQAPNPKRVHIIIDKLTLPEPIGDDSGFHPDVDDWIEEEHDIIM